MAAAGTAPDTATADAALTALGKLLRSYEVSTNEAVEDYDEGWFDSNVETDVPNRYDLRMFVSAGTAGVVSGVCCMQHEAIWCGGGVCEEGVGEIALL